MVSNTSLLCDELSLATRTISTQLPQARKQMLSVFPASLHPPDLLDFLLDLESFNQKA